MRSISRTNTHHDVTQLVNHGMITSDLVKFTEEILNGKLHFLCIVKSIQILNCIFELMRKTGHQFVGNADKSNCTTLRKSFSTYLTVSNNSFQ